MKDRKSILIIIGSASPQSSNLQLARIIQARSRDTCTIIESLAHLPHFDPLQSATAAPEEVILFRKQVEEADGFIICTPEYVFSTPAILKNALEWCVATTVFAQKPAGLITASAQGKKGHEKLQLIMQTLEARFTKDTTLLIQGVKGKFDREGELNDEQTAEQLQVFVSSFEDLVHA